MCIKKRILRSVKILVVLFYATTTNVHSQENPDVLHEQAYNFYHNDHNFSEAKKYYLKCVDLYKKQGKNKEAILDSYNAHRASTALMDPLDEAKQILLDALQLINTKNGNTREVAILYSGLGTVYNRIYQYENSRYYLEKSLQIFEKIGWESAKAHYYDALIYSGLNELELYNYNEAKIALNKALDFSKENDLESSSALSQLIRLYYQANEIKAFNELITNQENIKIIEEAPLYNYFDISNEIINSLKYQGDLQKALEYQEKLTKRIDSSPYKIHFTGRYTAMGYASIYHEMGKYKEAITILKENDDTETRKLKPSEASMCDLMIAESYMELGDFINASTYLKKSLSYHSDTFYQTDLVYNFHNVDPNLLEKLAVLGELLKRQSKNKYDVESEDKILAVYNTAHKVLLEVCKSSEGDNFLTEDNYKYLYSNLLEAYWQKWDKTKSDDIFYKALNCADDSKLVAIASELKTVKLDQLFKNKINPKVLNQENHLLTKIDSLKRLLDLSETKQLRSQLNKKTKELGSFKTKLKSNYPNYYLHKYGEDISIKDKLKTHYSNDNVIEYFVGDSAVFIFRAYKNQLNFDKIQLTKPLQDNIENFINNISNLSNNNYKSQGDYLSQKLIEPYLVHQAKNIVVLDDVLQKIPIEALWKGKEEGEFLISNYDILRCNSIKQVTEYENVKKDHKQSLVFAPFVNNGDAVNSILPSSFEEAEHISDLFKSEIFIDSEANKSNFINSVSNQKLIHLATHSTINTKEPAYSKIYFYSSNNSMPEDTYLNLDELYNLSLNADLVTLSSCETGIGKEIKGRGVMSFANALTFAGAKSTVMSLWKVPDQSSSIIMKMFYENLYDGLEKDEALKLAKLKYLQNVEDNALKHPYYWAGFVLSGDTSAINIDKGNNYLFYLLGLILLVLAILLIKRFK